MIKTVNLHLASKSAKQRGRFGAFGSLDKLTRGWRYLPPVQRTCGELPRGEDLIFSMNTTTLEIGQGLSGFKGYLWPTGLAALAAYLYGIHLFILMQSTLVEDLLATNGIEIAIFFIVGLSIPLGFVFSAFLFRNDFFG